MSSTAICSPPVPSAPAQSAGDELAVLGWEINANQYRIVHAAARFDDDLEWLHRGHRSASAWISSRLQIQTSTAAEWIRVGHALQYLPLVDAAFAAQEISYAKVRIVTRWADSDNETQLLELARERTAGRLTVAIAKVLADGGETDVERDARLHDERSFTTWTDGDGMTVIRVVLAPSVAKPVVAAVDELVRRIAATPIDTTPVEKATEAATHEANDSNMADSFDEGETLSADRVGRPSVTETSPDAATTIAAPPDAISPDAASSDATSLGAASPDAASRDATSLDAVSLCGMSPLDCATVTLPATLSELRRRWQSSDGDVDSDGWVFPSRCQQRADAFVALFLGCDVSLTTEVVVHIRGDGISFDDGTPATSNAVLRRLDDSFIRLLIHDAERRPINASSRRRHPTTRQKRVVMETHGHECVDCQSTDLLELDHNPSYEQTGHTVTHELEPRCSPCHRARHRHERLGTHVQAA